MRKKNRTLVPSNECCRWAVCAVAHWGPRRWLRRPFAGAAPICTVGWETGADLTASVDLTAFERCDRRHKLLFEYPIIFWTPRGSLNHVERALGQSRQAVHLSLGHFAYTRLAPVTTEEIGSHPLDSGSHLDSSRVLRTGKIL
jgi:hypothetical protein